MALGAEYKLEGGMVNVSADHLTGNNVYLDVVSVGATMNIMLAAVKADGMTVIENAAREPHIVDLANFLNSMGADVRGAGTDIIKIRGVKQMKGATYSIIPDQIEAGTYMAAAAAAGGDITVHDEMCIRDRSVDPDAFVIVGDAGQISGEGFKQSHKSESK